MVKTQTLSPSLPSRREAPGRRAQERSKPPHVIYEHRSGAEPPLSSLEFPGCKAIPMSREQLERWDGRVELWDSVTKTAWVMRDGPGPEHEEPIQSLAQMITLIAAVRGRAIRSFGASGMVWRESKDDPGRMACPDLSLNLDPPWPESAGGFGMRIDRHSRPDVVLEVDHTTDVRRGKLKLYEVWGLPEVWVEVPDRPPRWPRPKSQAPGLTIHLLEDGAYRPSPVSPAFLGWRAEDIHRAMNEPERSAQTNAMLEQLGRQFGERDGTGPDDDSLLHSLRRESRVEGHAEGHAEGRAEGRVEERADMVRELLLSRGLAVSDGFLADHSMIAAISKSAVLSAALACDSERDFLLRLAAARVR